MVLKQRKGTTFRISLFCLLLIALLLPLWTEAGTCAEENVPLNTSGNPNVSPVVDPLEQSEGYSAILYNNRNGLPSSEVTAIAQTAEGFIWFGTYSGLIRYDGSRFERIEAVEGLSNARCLFVDSKQWLWVGTNDAGVFRMKYGDVRKWDKSDGLGSDSIRSITEDRQGMIYVASAAGIATIDADLQFNVLKDKRIAGQAVKELRSGIDGLVYGVLNTGELIVLKEGKLLSCYTPDDYPFEEISAVLPDPEKPGYLYVGTEHNVCHGSLKKGFDSWDTLDVSPLESVSCLEFIGGQLWICSRKGFGKLEGDKARMLWDIPMDDSFCGVMTDMDGNLWIASERQGVVKIVPNRFTDLFAKYGMPDIVVNSTCMDDGRLFVGTDVGLIVIKDGKMLDRLPLTNAVTASGASIDASDLLKYMDGVRIRSIIRDSKDRLWISTSRGPGLIRYDHGTITQFTEEDGLPDERVRTVSECEDGSMLVATNNGIAVIKGDRVIKEYGREDGLDIPMILTITEGYDHEIIAGSDGGGIYLIGPDGIQTIDADDGLDSDIILRVKRSRTQDLFWIVTGDALAVITPDHKIKTIQRFPYANNYDLYENSRGDLWLLGGSGINVFFSKALEAGEPLEPLFLGIPNGLPYSATSNSYSELDEDGDLFLAGSAGVAKVNIETSFESASDMRIVIPFVDIDGKRCFPDEAGGFTVPPGTRTLKIYPYVIDFSLMDPRVSYRLEGYDHEATTVDRSDLRAVTYTNLPGGSYRFEIKLKETADGQKNDVQSVSIIKQKAVTEYLGFNLGIITAMLLLTGFLFYLYHRRKLRILEEKHREEAERERIGRELSLAAQIQAETLPESSCDLSQTLGYAISASMNPAKEVGGDFYDYFRIDDDHLCLVMADVSGKGIPAALFMMASEIVLADNAMVGKSPAEIMTAANATICAKNSLKMFVTVWLGILELSTGKLVASNAGHEYPVIRQPDGRFELLRDKHNFVIGGMNNIKYGEYELMFKPGTKLFLYTDGIPEATNAEDEMFGIERMLDALNAEPDATPAQILRNVQEAVEHFVDGSEQFDDLTMLCIEYAGRPE